MRANLFPVLIITTLLSAETAPAGNLYWKLTTGVVQSDLDGPGCESGHKKTGVLGGLLASAVLSSGLGAEFGVELSSRGEAGEDLDFWSWPLLIGYRHGTGVLRPNLATGLALEVPTPGGRGSTGRGVSWRLQGGVGIDVGSDILLDLGLGYMRGFSETMMCLNDPRFVIGPNTKVHSAEFRVSLLIGS